MRHVLFLILLTALAQGQRPLQSATEPELRVLCWNVWNGFSGEKELEDGSAWISTQKPDVVALQELVGIDEARLAAWAKGWGHGHVAKSKASGYAVGLTASQPIEVIERRTEGLHHGYLHARVAGVDYLVVHLHPGSWEFRLRESRVIAAKAAELMYEGRALIVLGDFNAHSAHDRLRLAARTPLLRKRSEGSAGNRRGDGFDHETMGNILGTGLVDLCAGLSEGTPGFEGTFPTRVFESSAKEEDQSGLLERIDYVLCDPRNAPHCSRVQMPRGGVLDSASDHYPLVADFRRIPAPRASAPRPNVLLILSDDLGFSDLGCYGSEIPTPNLDRLASDGVRFTQFTNTSKCSPSRASLLTGAYAHAVGMDRQPVAIEGARTIAEVLRDAGYRTFMAGKHHGTQNPISLGFERYFGLRDGACNYFNPGKPRQGEAPPAQKRANRAWCIDGETLRPFTPSDRDFYTTDAFTDAALGYLEDANESDAPFFLYVAYNAPHDPLQAPAEEIERHAGIYDAGYGVIRAARLEKQRSLGLFEEPLLASPAEHGPWDSLPDAERADQARRMQVYAAMITRLDANIGRLMDRLEAQGQLESTLILFASDNGASAENVQIGDGPIGAINRWSSLQRRWANVCNTPFAKYKNHSLEGGIRTPLIAHWPGGIENPGRLVREPSHLVDLLPTLVDLAGARLPASWEPAGPTPLVAGTSLAPCLREEPFLRTRPLFYQWWKGRAVRQGRWKLVQHGKDPWRLFNLEKDRIESTDLAVQLPERRNRMIELWEEWRRDPGFRGTP
ncbi:MAG: sulfatase-like hydrolase/transferase [Planctomycetota bacterium]